MGWEKTLQDHRKTYSRRVTGSRGDVFVVRTSKPYTCQLFPRYKREIFILGVLGFLKTTPSFPKIPEEVRSLPNFTVK